MHSAKTDWQWWGLAPACRVDPDGQMESEDDDSDDMQVDKPKRKSNGKMEWTLMKRWITGEKAEMEQEDSEGVVRTCT
jgi:hypothetical protein